MKPESCEAIVIGIYDYRESDKLVTLFTLEHGKLSCIARGAKRSVRRFGGALELFARLQVQIKVKHGLSDILEAEIVSIHIGIRSELSRIAYAGYACELISHLMPEGAANQRLFRLISSYLDMLDTHPADPSDRRHFETNLLNILGYRPSFDCCSRCGVELGENGPEARFTSSGEILCRQCGPHERPLAFTTLEYLIRSLQSGRFGTLRFPPPTLAETGALLDRAIASHTTAPLKSLSFLMEFEGSK